MEFKKIPSPPATASADSPGPATDPASQLRAALRLMAKRYLHGARGLLFIVGSLMLVISAGIFLSDTGIMGNQAGGTAAVMERWSSMGMDSADRLAAADIVIGIFVIACGWLVLAMPLAATLLPAALLIIRGIGSIVWSLASDKPPALGMALLHIVLGVILIRAVRDAFNFRREAANVRERFRAAAVVENLQRQRDRQPLPARRSGGNP